MCSSDLGHRCEGRRVHHALAKVGELALGKVEVPTEGDVGDRPPEHGVAEELEALVALGFTRLGAPTAMGERAAQQGLVGEPIPETVLQVGQRRRGRTVDVRRP